ncbi:MAG: S8 family serine peptidase [Albidovulum sp.]|nr:S8 family serine peptidase [Albidovulum sp.]
MKSAMLVVNRLSVSIAAALVAACGGGSGSSPSFNPPENPTVPGYDLTLGVPSSESSARAALFGGRFDGLPYFAPNGEEYSSVLAANRILNEDIDFLPIAAYDTKADRAWELGWTGKGVKVGVLDYFNTNGIVDFHGDYVAVVIHSVAPEAELGLESLEEYPDQNPIFNQVAAGNKFAESGFDIINNSWGIERNIRNPDGSYSGRYDPDFDFNAVIVAESLIEDAANSDYARDDTDNVLWIYAAGNSGEHCFPRTLDNCNFYGAIERQLNIRNYTGASQIIWVGALDDDGERLADYSLEAGNLEDSFIVEHDDVLTYNDAAGTSFAAPRVTGAAAVLRQKFPNLGGADLKQILLQTAEDIGPLGVDRIFGHGRLDLLNALSPQGTLRPK